MSDEQKSQHLNDGRSFYRCFVCDRMFRYGPHVYEGHAVQGWGREMICRRCEKSNWDGIVPTPQLEDKFRKKGIKVEYNAKGFIVIPL